MSPVDPPPWMNCPEMIELRQRALAEIGFAPDGGSTDEDDEWSFDDAPPTPDPVLADLLGGISRRALAEARDNLTAAKAQYENAVRQARAAGWSWAEIGRILGVSRQLLHKRFRSRPQD
jgi:DNA-directed RNA polymerase specialized sigma24 family protein